ncbi:lipid-A-disaccharide synthase [Aquamicrobium sp. LC103]|uniref:lipid-A-disaccharide synthase n=1 Tax=Aquamicrobium sp. LC103 TaxID=1120658 RepID=UPI00063E9B01|nr:lipid-A-disaccharide synthase [Aquamicrobium sp. LC103]TKT76972.1 lipid-A-disaccharide synthase [Aquamicrobium sp. LC103]
MQDAAPLRIAIVAGEESGDLLGADLVAALTRKTGRPVELVGVGGRHLEALGLKPLFDGSEIALMGVTAVVRDLPRLIRRIGETARLVLREKPDCLITIDSPEFSLRVARKVKAADPTIPTVHYVCPSVWAWRPGRAAQMRAYVDHVLCILPFEPDELRRLNGPAGTFVGHRLTQDRHILAAAESQLGRPDRGGREKKLLLLPGSRRAEVAGLMDDFGRAAEILGERGNRFQLLLPTVPRLADTVSQATANWKIRPEIILDPERKGQAFAEADAALAASGTVLLELALSRVPVISCYRTDFIWRALSGLIKAWSAALPNLIAGWPVVPEFYNETVRPEYLARLVEQLWSNTPARAAQLHGFEAVAAALETPRPSGELAAETVLSLVRTA